jgi:hypothetical protein
MQLKNLSWIIKLRFNFLPRRSGSPGKLINRFNPNQNPLLLEVMRNGVWHAFGFTLSLSLNMTLSHSRHETLEKVGAQQTEQAIGNAV